MGRILNLNIIETEADLKQLYQKQTNAKAKERVQALYLLKSGEVKKLEALAQVLSRDTATLYRWFQKYEKEGLVGLLQHKYSTGRKPAIPLDAIEKLYQRLQDPKSFSSYSAIQTWLQEEHGVEASYKVVHKTVLYKLGYKLKEVSKT